MGFSRCLFRANGECLSSLSGEPFPDGCGLVPEVASAFPSGRPGGFPPPLVQCAHWDPQIRCDLVDAP